MDEPRLNRRGEFEAVGFVQVSSAVVFDHRVPSQALRLYLALKYHARANGYCFPSQDTLASELGISRSTVQRQLDLLKELGFISCEPRGLGVVNDYWMEIEKGIYIDSEDRRRFSDESRANCGLRIIRSKQPKSPEPALIEIGAEPDVPELAREELEEEEREKLRVSSEAIERAAAKTRNGIEKKLTRQQQKASKRKKIKGQVKQREVWEIWETKFSDLWPDAPQTASLDRADKSLIKKLMENYDGRMVIKMVEHLFDNWSQLAKRWSLRGMPTVKLLWGYRKLILAEIETGKKVSLPDQRSKEQRRRAALDRSEFDEETASHLPDVGWGDEGG